MTYKRIINFPPPENIYLMTKIDDEEGERNVQILKKSGNLWFGQDNMYVYYSPTHWRNLTYDEAILAGIKYL